MRRNTTLILITLTVIASGCVSGNSNEVSTEAGVTVDIVHTPENIQTSNIEAVERTVLGTEAYWLSLNVENTGESTLEDNLCVGGTAYGSEGAELGKSNLGTLSGLSPGSKKKVQNSLLKTVEEVDINITKTDNLCW